jgi:hypothetical protein
MDQPGINLFQAIRLLPDIANQVDVNVSPLEQTSGELFAYIPIRIGTLRLGVKLVLARNLIVRLYACAIPATVVSFGCDRVLLSGILVKPLHLEPPPRIRIVWRNQLRALRVGAGWMAERPDVARQNEIEWLDLA